MNLISLPGKGGATDSKSVRTAGSTEPVGLAVRSLYARGRGGVTLENVSFTVPKQSITTVFGGAHMGKSLLLAVIGGSRQPSSGEVVLATFPITNLSVKEKIRCGVQFVPATRHEFPSLSVRESILLGAYWRGRDSLIDADLESMWELFPELASVSKARTATLEPLQHRFVAVARGLMSRPRLVVLDEPLYGLDVTQSIRMLEALSRVVQRGTTLLMAEQPSSLVFSAANYVVVLRSGQVVAEGPRDQLNRRLLDDSFEWGLPVIPNLMPL